MSKAGFKTPAWIKVASIFAIVFGVMTIISGGSALFVESASKAAGAYVPFVLWFNFISGFVYVVVGVGIWKLHEWAGLLSIFLAASILFVFLVFGMHIMSGESYEMRTVLAMTFRFSVWATISFFYYSLQKEINGE